METFFDQVAQLPPGPVDPRVDHRLAALTPREANLPIFAGSHVPPGCRGRRRRGDPYRLL